MNKTTLYKNLLSRLNAADIFRSDFPEETAEKTLVSLWDAVSEVPLPAEAASSQLPDLSEQQQQTLEDLIDKRISGIPLAYLTGRTRFMGLDFICEPGVLIPRNETELLASTVISTLSENRNSSGEIIGMDVGCGCGNLSCSIASTIKEVTIHAIDITEECVSLTRKNIAALNLEESITVYKGSLFTPVEALHLDEQVDFIVSNPPYIPKAKLQSDLGHLTHHEPEEAFNGGPWGFSVHQKLIKESLTYLKPGGFLTFEFGIGQEKQVAALFKRCRGYAEPMFVNDDDGNPRVVRVVKDSG